MMKMFAISIMTALFAVWIPAHATIWYVHPDSALNSIQTALYLCTKDDTVLVGAGTYYEHLAWPDKLGIDLISEYGPDTTILNGSGAGNVITLCSRVDTTTTISGFTIQNGSSGIHIPSDASGILSNNVITDNNTMGVSIANRGQPRVINNTITLNGYGIYSSIHGQGRIVDNVITHNSQGGIYYGPALTTFIVGNTITYNTSTSGGGINVSACSVDTSIIYGNIITHNTAEYGGGMYIGFFDYRLFIRNNVIADNTATVCGGGIYMYATMGTVDSCTIADNQGDGVCIEHMYSPSPVTLKNNNIEGNTGYGINNTDDNIIACAEYNWWGDATGPYHPDDNPAGQGDSVSDHVDFTPWLDSPVGVKEDEDTEIRQREYRATIIAGPLRLPEGKKCRLFDITGRCVEPDKIQPGIYFIEIDGEITQKVVKVS